MSIKNGQMSSGFAKRKLKKDKDARRLATIQSLSPNSPLNPTPWPYPSVNTSSLVVNSSEEVVNEELPISLSIRYSILKCYRIFFIGYDHIFWICCFSL